MKYFALLLCAICPIISFTMETEQKNKPIIAQQKKESLFKDIKPTIMLDKEMFYLLLKKHYSSNNFSYSIQIPEKGATFELEIEEKLCLIPDKIKLDIEKGTQHISIVTKDINRFAIINDRNEELALLFKRNTQ